MLTLGRGSDLFRGGRSHLGKCVLPYRLRPGKSVRENLYHGGQNYLLQLVQNSVLLVFFIIVAFVIIVALLFLFIFSTFYFWSPGHPLEFYPS